MGHIKLDRKILDWEWWSDKNTCRLFIYMLLEAEWCDSSFMGTEIKRGSFVSTLPKIAEKTGLSIKEVRTALNHLKRTGEVAVKTTNKYSVFTVNNYNRYQASGSQKGSQGAVKGQSKGSQKANLPIIKENKNIRIKEYKKSVSDETVCQTETVRRVVDRWNLLKSKGVKPIRKISSTSKRYGNLVARINEYSEEEVIQAIDNIESSEFLRGRNSKGWCICFDWFVLPNNFHKVLEGNYENRMKKDKFNNYNGRSYDMDALERRLVQ